MRRPENYLDHAEFLERWGSYIVHRVRYQTRRWRGARDHFEDLQQAAYLAGWDGYQTWRALPEEEQTESLARLLVITAAADAVQEAWSQITGVPRNDHARGAGVRAAVLRQSFAQIAGPSRDARSREATIARAIVGYHLLTEGLLHGAQGLIDPETALARSEVRERILFALDRLQSMKPDLHRLIVGHYFKGRTFKDVGEEMGITEPRELSRMHFRALAILEKELREFASALSARNTGHTLADEPSGGTFT